VNGNGNGRHRWFVMCTALFALAVLIATPIWMVVKVGDQNDRTAAVAAQNRALVNRLEQQGKADDAYQAAADLKICRKTNYALRANREAIKAAEDALINVLRMSPHSAMIADQVAASLPPLPTAEQSETDCAAPTGLGPEDYATP
jgi:type VI protein secretion system component VasK